MPCLILEAASWSLGIETMAAECVWPSLVEGLLIYKLAVTCPERISIRSRLNFWVGKGEMMDSHAVVLRR